MTRYLTVGGRLALFRYTNQDYAIDHAIEMGLCAAEEILSQQIGSRVGRVGNESVYFERYRDGRDILGR